MTSKVKVWRLDQGGRFLVVRAEALDAILEELRYSDTGDSFTVTVEEWEREDLEALPEFDGF